jgi:hypothetical protein
MQAARTASTCAGVSGGPPRPQPTRMARPISSLYPEKGLGP